MPFPHRRIVLLAAATALVVGALAYLSISAAPHGSLCGLGGPGWPAWRGSGSAQSAGQQVSLDSAQALDLSNSGAGSTSAEGPSLMDLRTAAELAGAAADAQGRIGWRAGIRFAAFGEEQHVKT